MDAKVDDFFNEINQIAPPKQDENKPVNGKFVLFINTTISYLIYIKCLRLGRVLR